MNTDIKDKWVTALRSGKYKQGGGHLRFTDSKDVTTLCCLGVLCDVMGAEWRAGRPILDDVILKRINNTDDFADEEEYLSQDALDLVGLDKYDQKKLARMNDVGKSFDLIADYIETEL